MSKPKNINPSLLFCFLFSLSITAQEFEFKKVSKAELKENIHPRDSTASAATLFEKGYLTMRYDDGWLYELEVTKRVKIYNKEGYDYATVSLPYYYGDQTKYRENIKKIKAYVYNLKGNKIKDEKLSNKDIIDEQTSDVWKEVKFTFPNLKPGSVIEYKYTYQSPNIDELPEWRFQDEIPVNYSEYQLIIPEYFGYNERAKGYHTINKNLESTMIDISFRMDNRGKNVYGNGSSLNSSVGTATAKAAKYSYVAKEVPKLKDEAFVNNHTNFITSIKHELSFFKDPSTNNVKQFTTNWEEVSLRLQKSESFGVELDRRKYFEEDIDPIIQESSSQEEKIMRLLNFVKNHMTWNDYVSIYVSDKLRNVYKERRGNIADINLMLTAMLRYAGVNAHPVLVSTINNGIPNNAASTTDFNYIISGVELSNDKVLLLDASNPFTSPNLLPIRCLNWFGRLVRPNGTSKQINLSPIEVSKDDFIMNIDISEDGSLNGKMRRKYTEHFAYRYRINFSSVNKEDYISKLQNQLGVTINDYKNENIYDLSEPVIETIDFEKDNAFDVINGNIYLSPLLFLAQEENPFKQDQLDRKLPIDFTFPKSKKYMINIKLPEGYEVDYIPESTAVGLPNQKGVYRFSVKKSPLGDLQVVVQKEIKEAILSHNYYKPLKDFYTTIVAKETDKIVFKKI